MKTARSLTLLAGLLVVAATPAFGQGIPPATEADKDAEYMRLFTNGLEAITARRLDESESLFRACIRMDPKRPIAYYNLACTYSLNDKLTIAFAVGSGPL